MSSLSITIENQTAILTKINEALDQIPELDLSALTEFPGLEGLLEEFELIYAEIMAFVNGLIKQVAKVLDQAIEMIKVIARELVQLLSVQRFISLLFNTVSKISAAFSNFGDQLNIPVGQEPVIGFVNGTDTVNSYINDFFRNVPDQDTINSFIGKLVALKNKLLSIQLK